MNIRFDWRRALVTASALLLVFPGSAWADPSASSDPLLDVLLENGSITQEQYDRIRDEQGAAKTLPPVDAAGDADGASAGAAPDASDADDDEPVTSTRVKEIVNGMLEEEFPVTASYTSKGFRLETRDGNWQTNLQWRFQFRLTWPYQGDPRQIATFNAPEETSFQARRLRMKIGGHGYRPWLKYYFEVDLQPLRDEDDSPATTSARVIDWRVDVAKFEEIGLRVGQWKIDYNRERVDSSGRQAFVERSIVNRIFTIDRQMGVQLRGRLFKGTYADLRYYAGAFNGQGRGVINDDNNLMYVGRLQWNFLGRDLKLRQTDVERTEKPTGSLSGAVAQTIGRCTRFSSSGCGNLDGFTSPAVAQNGQFNLLQAQQGFAFKWQGFAVQQEFHWKRIDDRVNNFRSEFLGAYGQVGYFFHEICEDFPEPLELGFRYAWLREPNAVAIAAFVTGIDNQRQEFTAAANWFFAGHNNKLTLDYSYLTIRDELLGRRETANRVRLQWDISF